MNSFLWIVSLVSTLVASARGAHLFSPNHRLLTLVDLMSTLPPPTPIVPGIVAECDGSTVQVESLENDKCYELSSPNYANPPYPSGVTGSPYQCRYSIKHPTQVANAQVTILTSEFALQDSNGCSKDFLRLAGISGGNTEGTLSSTNVLQLCGTLNAEQALDVNLGTRLVVLFRTDSSDAQYKGWRFVLCYEPMA